MAQITLNSSGVASSGSLLLQTNGTTTQATVDTSGNLGLGVTPSAWGTGYKVVDINTYGALAAVSSWVGIAGNNYYNGTNWIYKTTGYSSLYQQAGGQHIWLNSPSGSAGGTVSFTQAMTLDTSGNLGIGTTSPASYQLGGKFAVAGSTSGFYFNDANNRLILDGAGTNRDLTFYFRYSNTATITSDSNLIFQTGTSPSERARIDSSGNLLVGSTSNTSSAAKLRVYQSDTGNPSFTSEKTTTAVSNHVLWYNPNGAVGAIGTNGSTTYYNTSSDYRLKENIEPMTGALAKVDALKPVIYTWKTDGSSGQGFIAHELAEVVPDAVTGEKDAVDEDGNPVYQGIDTSFLVATLTAAIQEMKTIIDQQAERITALEQA